MKFAVLGTVVAALLVGGCAQIRQHKGIVLDPQLAAGIQPGVDNKDSVEKTLGRPSFTGQFAPNDWYYVSRDVNQVAFVIPMSPSRRSCSSASIRRAMSPPCSAPARNW